MSAVAWSLRQRCAVEGYTRGELAEICGVTVEAIHWAEKHGHIPEAPRDETGARFYPPELADAVVDYFRRS